MGVGLNLRGISKVFDNTQVLRGVDLDIRPGEFLTLVGPSGCGKSTLLKLIAGLDHPDSGTISINNIQVNHLRPSQRDIAMVFQNYALYPHMRVAENLAMPLLMAQLPFVARLPLLGKMIPGFGNTREQIRKKVLDVAENLEIKKFLNRKPSELSGGQRQRVALGRAMVRQPGIFLMDEPLSNLDAALRSQVRTELIDLQRSLGSTFIFVTHDQVEAMTMSGRIAVMMGGEILQVATPTEIYNAPRDIRVAQFIGSPSINILQGNTVQGGEISLFGNMLQIPTYLPPNSAVQLGIRPEDIKIKSTESSYDSSFEYKARIRLIENLGNEVILHLNLTSNISPKITARLSQREWASIQSAELENDTIRISFPDDYFLVFDIQGKLVASQNRNNYQVLEAAS